MLRTFLLAGCSAVVAAVLIGASTPAVAADLAPEPVAENNWYLSLQGGWKFSEDLDDDLDATHGGTEPGNSAELSIETDDGWRIGGALGYRLNDWLAVEAEVGYMEQDFNSADFEEGEGEFDGLAGEEFDLGGDISILTGMINGLVGVPVGGLIRPYVGAGLGVAHINADASISELGFSLDDSDTVFAAQAFAGVDVPITESVAIGGRVRYLHVDDFDLVDDEDHEHSINPDGIISAEVVLTFNFFGP